MKKELLSFREGIKWGFVLFAHTDEKTREFVRILSSGKIITQKQFDKEVDEGRWDSVLEYRNAK